MFRFARPIASTLCVLLAVGLSSAACAQEAAKPATPHCGGLICDVYYAGVPANEPSPTSLPCRDFICGMFGGRTPEQPVAAAEPDPAAPSASPAKPAKVKKKRVAKAAPKPIEAAAQ